MKQYADIVAFDKNGQIALIVEVKNKRGTSSSWAAKMRRNMFAHGLMPHAPFFLLALPDSFYLWKSNSNATKAIEPTHIIDPQSFLQSYYDIYGVSPENLTGRSFELIVTSWLNQLFAEKSFQDLSAQESKWLVESGLSNRLAGGHLELEAVA